MTTILTKKSDTPGAVPATANLTNATGGAELAVNTADKRLFSINSSSSVIEIGTNPSSLTVAGEGSITVFRAGSATITNLTATSATIDNFTFTSATVTRLAATSAVITDLSATVGRIGSGTITQLVSTSASISNLSGASASITTLTGVSANITTLTGTTFGTTGTTQLRGASGAITTLTGTTLGYTSGSITNLAVTSLTVSSLSLSNATFTSATITTLKSTSATVDNLASTSANITTLTGTTFGTTATTQLRGASAQITTLTGSSANITTVTGTTAGFSSGNITQFGATSATIGTLTGTSANVTTLSGTTLTYGSGSITNLAVTSLTVSSLSLANATFTSATITTLTGTSANITTVTGTTAGFGSANITQLGSTSATIGTLTGTSANITTLTGTTFGTTATTQLRGASAQITTLTATSSNITTLTSSSGTITNLLATTANISGAAVISVNSSSDALRITQVGSGNALLVEDSANPDSTPVVIDSGGNLIQGNTAIVAGVVSGSLQTQGTGANGSSHNLQAYSASTGGTLEFDRSRGALGAQSVVSSGDRLGRIFFCGSDGAAFIRGAEIYADVDGTPGTNDMPGRLVFSTTADGASSPTERLRIDSAGNVGVGIAPSAGRTFTVAKNLTGAVSSYGIFSSTTVQPDVTSNAFLNATNCATASNGGTPYTISNIIHNNASQGTFNADSTVTNQIGFFATSSLIGATNNYGFYSNIASGSNRWNFFANGTAQNYFAGDTLIGTTTNTNSSKLVASGTISEAVAGTQYLVASQYDIGTDPNEIPLNQYLGALAYVDSEWVAPQVGSGITGGTGTICKTSFAVEGGVKKMQVLIDLTGLNSGGTAGDIIGVNGTANPCYIAQIPSTFTILGGRMTCLETPAGGDTDIDLYSATEGTGVEDQAITALTETQIINAGTQSAGTVTYFSADPAANTYFYLVGQSTSNATYTAGRFLIEVFGA